MRNQWTPPILLLAILTAGAAQSQASLFDHLYRPDSLVEVALQCDWDSLLVVRKTEKEIDGKFFFGKKSGEMTELKVGISVRGKFRRRICQFPPVRLEFSKKELRSEGILPLDNMKLVTHCLDDSLSQERMAREYLIYRMYQALSPYAFRAQLAQVKYLDVDRSKESKTNYGILLEDDLVLAHRMGLQQTDTINLSPGDFPEDMVDVHALFQYLIGNTDWNLIMSRNVDLLEEKGARRFVLIPYDFDFSGFVNASYAIPNPDYQLKSLRQRVYLGGQPPSESARNKVLAQKTAFIDLIRKSAFLSAAAKADCIGYLNSGFRDIKKNKMAFPKM